MDMNHDIGKRIRALRESKGLSREQVVRKIGICQQTLHKYEEGHSRISIERLYAIAGALGVQIEYLLT